MSTIIESYSTEGKIYQVLEKMNYRILMKKVLVSQHPIFALAEKGGHLVFIELIGPRNSERYFLRHFNWLEEHLNFLKLKFALPVDLEIIALLIVLEDREFRLELGEGNLEICSYLFTKEQRLKPYFNFIINYNSYMEFLKELGRLGLKERFLDFASEILNKRPLKFKRRCTNYVQIITGKEVHHFYVCSRIIYYHYGTAPFRPQII